MVAGLREESECKQGPAGTPARSVILNQNNALAFTKHPPTLTKGPASALANFLVDDLPSTYIHHPLMTFNDAMRRCRRWRLGYGWPYHPLLPEEAPSGPGAN